MPFHQIRNKKREISKEEALNILEKAEYGVLSTVSEDGQTYGVPVSHVVYDGAIWFHCAKEGHKIDNIEYSEKVCFTAVGKAVTDAAGFTVRYESAIVFGTAQQAPASEWPGALTALCAKYSPGYEEKAQAYMSQPNENLNVIKITIDHITGKANRG